MLKTVKRIVYFAIASVVYACTLGGRVGRGQSIVLCYHGVTAQQKAAFERQIQCVHDRIVSIDQILDKGSIPIGKMPNVILTFDDAFSNLCVNAVPLLNKLGLPAVIFAVTNNMGSKPMWDMPDGHLDVEEQTMTDEQLAKCLSGNIRIGSHTCSHIELARLSGRDLERELRDSKKYLEELLGVPVHDLALPHGSYSEQVLNCAADVGYRRVFTLEAQTFNGPQDYKKIGRFTMSPNTWIVEFVLVCSGAYCWLGPFRQLVNRLRQKNHAMQSL